MNEIIKVVKQNLFNEFICCKILCNLPNYENVGLLLKVHPHLTRSGLK